MKISSANVFLTAVKVRIAFTNSLLSFRSRTRINVAAGKMEQDRVEKDSVLISFTSTSITDIDSVDFGSRASGPRL